MYVQLKIEGGHNCHLILTEWELFFLLSSRRAGAASLRSAIGNQTIYSRYTVGKNGDENMGANNSLSNWTTQYLEGQGQGGEGGGGGTHKMTRNQVDDEQLVVLLSRASAASSGFSFSTTTAPPAAASVGIIGATNAASGIRESNLLPPPPPSATTTRYSFLHSHHPLHTSL
ncbi:hypothetical protein Cgig2_014016 [Carnegiea gigantea]|uniref:Uncharacterized protein n=1 Tax=Carnegiea gigantea TaxID=171969 RepID=A0A9Q1QRA2_9CARY|nr:hypothetical protein Cgig2_014016 [Carnegiea gigantea]